MIRERTAADPDAARLAERIRWPDGPVCPYCGERERMVPESSRGRARIRYECPACEVHRGYFRRPGATKRDSEEEPARHPVLPRFPR